MEPDKRFVTVGPNWRDVEPDRPKPGLWGRLRLAFKGKPVFSTALFLLILLGCIFSEHIVNHDPSEFYLDSLNQPPGKEFYFGTDSMGRDIYSIIWHGGRASLLIGLFSTVILTVIGVVYGSIAGTSGMTRDNIMMRGVELVQSIPLLLTILLIVSLMSGQNVITISLVIGTTSWFALARIVRTEVKQIRNS